jgi:alanine racemase
VPIGYGDGVPRALSRGGRVVIGGRSFPIRGAISMDQLMVEVDAGVRLGDEVVLIGANPGEPTAVEWAGLAGTIPHEVLTGFGARVALDHVRV